MFSIPEVPEKQRPMLFFLLVLTIASIGGLQGWRTLFNNFAVESAGLNGQEIGVVQSVREIPGFLALFAVWVMLLIKEHKLSALSITILGLGVASVGFYPTYLGICATTLILSFGFHYYETTNQSLTLQYFDTATTPVVFAAIRSVSAATNVVMGVLVYLLSYISDFKVAFLIIGLAAAAAGVWGMMVNPVDNDLMPQRKEMVFRKRYILFYFLTFMSGARRQIFMAFSVFLLVKVFEFSVREIAVLFVVNNIFAYFTSPLIGKAILRFGERRVLSVEYAGLIFIFLAYAVTGSRWVAALLYIMDHLLFNFAIAIRTFFQKTADPSDIAPSMAVGFTINHIAAVVLPVVGGALWVIDYRIPFIAGAAMSLVSLVAVQRIPDFTKAKG
ncbi:MAG: MFS transporter [Deltaproteobacteria bacterium]|nr:MAG: MFS transporter [Deltaproteobacteria bacterium]